MELNWSPQARWQREEHGPADPLSPWPGGPSTVPPGPPAANGGHAGDDGQGTASGPDSPEDNVEQAEHPEAAANKQQQQRHSLLAFLRRVSFRSRVSILVGIAVGISVALASLVSYIAVSRQLENSVTSNLQDAIGLANGIVYMDFHSLPAQPAVSADRLINFEQQTGDSVQVITPKQVISLLPGEPENSRFFPVSASAQQALASGPTGNVEIENLDAKNGAPYRVASVPTAIPGVVIQIGYPLTTVDNTLAFLRLVLILVSLGGVALAAGLGWAVGRASIRPVEDLTLAVEHVTATQDLSATIDDEGNDELARLARSFNAMLAALAASKDQQAQLVSDAGHELRTPLTSLRTNIEVLMRTKELPGADRDALLEDVDAQLKELTTLVGDLVDLAREDERQAEPELVNFDELVERAVERAHRRATTLRFDVAVEPGLVQAQPALLERAVMNVLDNAAKWSPPDGRVSVTLEANRAWHLTVTDEGPGIAPEDLPHVFERFYRAPTARSMPGSGLGLAIVKGVITSHGGSIDVSSPPAGGTMVEIVLPLDGAGSGSGPENGEVA